MKKGNLYFLLTFQALILVYSNGLLAEDKMKPMSQHEISGFEQALKNKGETTFSLESQFVQEKNLEMLNRKMISKGIFRYMKEDKIAFLYETPLKYHMIINGSKLKIVNNGKAQTIELKNNPMMKEMKGLIEASFLGRLSGMDSSYKISYFQNENKIFVFVVPSNKSVSEMIKKISVTFEKVTLDILQLQLDEGAKSSTIYYFTQPKFNTIKSDETFRIL
ncbi:MAG: outer membrane lipoprotein carrier protein LolA [Bacteroidales bacterium]|jgi:outer membrane lipoprotein-sorting protein